MNPRKTRHKPIITPLDQDLVITCKTDFVGQDCRGRGVRGLRCSNNNNNDDDNHISLVCLYSINVSRTDRNDTATDTPTTTTTTNDNNNTITTTNNNHNNDNSSNTTTNTNTRTTNTTNNNVHATNNTNTLRGVLRGRRPLAHLLDESPGRPGWR